MILTEAARGGDAEGLAKRMGMAEDIMQKIVRYVGVYGKDI